MPAVNSKESKGILSNKLAFILFLRHMRPQPVHAEPIGCVEGEAFTPLGAYRTLADAFVAHPRLAVKPIRGSGGHGVAMVTTPAAATAGAGLRLIETALTPHPYAVRIFPGAINTLRLLTLRDPDSGRPFVAAAAHRFGVAASMPTDNCSRGGLTVDVDLASGRLGWACRGLDRGHGVWHETHPETGAAITGETVPYWTETVALALRLAGAVPGLKMAGWDLCVTPSGPAVVEGNGDVPNPNLFQVHRPLLRDPRVVCFFHRYGVVGSGKAARLRAGDGRAARPTADADATGNVDDDARAPVRRGLRSARRPLDRHMVRNRTATNYAVYQKSK